MNTPLRLLALVAVSGALSTAVVAAPKTGGTVYSIRNELILRAEKTNSASPVTKVGFAESLKVDEMSGAWLKVSTKGGSGWVFAGYVRDEKPEREKLEGVAAVDASETTTAAAARPLSPEAEQYAQRHSQVSAGKDVDWVEAEAHKVTKPIVDSYMKENKKGEYQE
jgi:hypothetical protein